MFINRKIFEKNREKNAKAWEEAPQPIICKTIEEKEQLIREWDEKEKKWKDEHRFPLFSDPLPLSYFYRPDVFTEAEHLERNKTEDFYQELLPRYFVCSEGNDLNDGLSQQNPFKTLGKALKTAKNGIIKRIEVVGMLSDKNEKNAGKLFAFNIDDTGNDEITICGQIIKKPGEETSYPSRLEAVHAKQVISIASKNNTSQIRLRNIAISGGKEGGMIIKNAKVIIGKGVFISENCLYGICIDSGSSLVMEEGRVSDNKGGGICMKSNALFDLKGGVISNNRPQISQRHVGGVSIHGRKSLFRMSGGIISYNQSSGHFGGGGVSITDEEWTFGPHPLDKAMFDKFLKQEKKNEDINNGSIFEMTGGSIIGNKAYQGGGVSIKSPCAFKLYNGVIMGNIAEYGGGICVNELAQLKNYNKDDLPITFEMTGGYIMGNFAQESGGGISAIVSNVGPYESIRIVCKDGRITGNKSIKGGGIYLPDGCCHLSGNVIVNDNIAKYGGGAYIGHGFNIMRHTCFVIGGNAKISGNIAEFWGGGICIADGVCIMSGGYIKENIAKDGGGVFPGTTEEISQMEHGKVFDPDPVAHNSLLRVISGRHPNIVGVFDKTTGDIKNNLPNDVHPL
jgi:hypothetical protein